MFSYCEPSVSIWQVWFDHGINHCFLDTLFALLTALVVFVFGGIELGLYWRHGTLKPADLRRPSGLHNVHVGLHLCLLMTTIIRGVLYASQFYPAFYGYNIVGNGVVMVVWPTVLMIMQTERHYELPSPPSRGYGVVLLLVWSLTLMQYCLSVVSLNSRQWWWKLHHIQDQVQMGVFTFEWLCVLSVFGIGLRAPGLPTASQRYAYHHGASTDRAQLLNDAESGSASGAGNGNNRRVSWVPDRASVWRGLFRKLRILFPYLWPSHDPLLQLAVLACIGILVIGRVTNVYIPILYKSIVDALSVPSLAAIVSEPHLHFPWQYILIYCALRSLQGSSVFGGFLNVIRGLLWVKVEQYTTRTVQTQLFSHLHSLSLRWHIGRKTGEVLRVMDRGTDSINNLLNYLLFNIVPTMVDIAIAVVYFTVTFSGWFGLIVFATMIVYLVWTFKITEWRTKFRRTMNKLDNEFRAIGVDSLINFETVKYYNNEQYEAERYREALLKSQYAAWVSQASLYLLNGGQNVIITLGLMAGSLLCAWMVAQGRMTVGDYVLFATYIMQLYSPLNVLGMVYRQIQTAFIDMENMFELLDEGQEVQDVEGAVQLYVDRGRIEFENVNFSYVPEKRILQDISFTVEPGQTVALVGPSGGGKSTIIRLIFRFYNLESGRILLDGQDISQVQQSSLRSYIGVVPQDTVLFNDTISYNIGYGKHTAEGPDIEKAAAAADIHERILTFPDQYNTMVGERGLKLSGGEKQRVAIARTLLKAPDYILLDEATSALDTTTERNIQASLKQLCQGRTTLVVAHRLSTITHANLILVLDNGCIVERGTHEQLLAADGVYAHMWTQQSTVAASSSAVVDES